MNKLLRTSRRRFIQATTATIAAAPLMSFAKAGGETGLQGKMFKTLKIGMVKVPGTLSEKFAVVKSVGFDGIEMNSPGMDVNEARQAIKESGLPVDGTVCSSHWKIRHTSADADTRARALSDLQTAIQDTKAVGGDTVLLVVGHGDDGPREEIWERSIENIAKAIPLAEEHQITIAIENVWNKFLYDHEGDANQTANEFVKYVDQLDSPRVGMQFDIGNHWKYGSMGDWIRALNKRIVKLDVKGFSRGTGKFTKIGEGDIDWADVRRALVEISYNGWVAAEVSGGNADRLKEVAMNMDRVFGLKDPA